VLKADEIGGRHEGGVGVLKVDMTVLEGRSRSDMRRYLEGVLSSNPQQCSDGPVTTAGTSCYENIPQIRGAMDKSTGITIGQMKQPTLENNHRISVAVDRPEAADICHSPDSRRMDCTPAFYTSLPP